MTTPLLVVDTASVVSDISSLPEACQSSKKVFVGKIPTSARPEEIKVINESSNQSLIRALLFSCQD